MTLKTDLMSKVTWYWLHFIFKKKLIATALIKKFCAPLLPRTAKVYKPRAHETIKNNGYGTKKLARFSQLVNVDILDIVILNIWKAKNQTWFEENWLSHLCYSNKLLVCGNLIKMAMELKMRKRINGSLPVYLLS